MDFFNVNLQALQTQYQANQTVQPHQLTPPAITIELVTQNMPSIVTANPALPPVAMNLTTPTIPATPQLGPQNLNALVPHFVLTSCHRKVEGG
ncbi:MAG: hypothetical protein Q8K75_04475 [Chlamydiales bacterium]|nr:hypothetical protein [Chlamydiales bacterium]